MPPATKTVNLSQNLQSTRHIPLFWNGQLVMVWPVYHVTSWLVADKDIPKMYLHTKNEVPRLRLSNRTDRQTWPIVLPVEANQISFSIFVPGIENGNFQNFLAFNFSAKKTCALSVSFHFSTQNWCFRL